MNDELLHADHAVAAAKDMAKAAAAASSSAAGHRIHLSLDAKDEHEDVLEGAVACQGSKQI
jgi:hypothetical protein